MKKILLLLIVLIPAFLQAQSRPEGRPLFDPATIGEIRLSMPGITDWVGALDSMRLYGEGMMLCDVQIDGANYSGAGVRFRGNNSYTLGLKRNPFHIKLNQSVPEQNHQGNTSIKLSSALRDPSLVREVLFFETARQYMPAPQASYTKLFINNEYIGLFVNVESPNEQFLQTHFGSSTGSCFKAGVDYQPNIPATCKQNIFSNLEYEEDLACYKGNFEMCSTRGWLDLQELTRILNKDPRSIGDVLDVDHTLWMHALNNVMVNLHSYAGNHSTNYYLYKDLYGRFQPFVWDLNLSFGSYKNTGSGSDLDLRDLQRLDPLLHADNPYKPLISKLLENPFYKKIYLAHMRQILEEQFNNGQYEKRARELQALIVVPFNDDPNKAYTLEEFQNSLIETIGRKSKIPGIVELMSKRTRFLKEHPELTTLPSTILDASVQGRGQYEKERLNTFTINATADRFPKRLLLYYRFQSEDPFSALPLNVAEAESEMPTGVKKFTVSIDAPSPDATIEFYLLAENAGAVSFFPTRYRQEPKKVSLDDLNK